MTQRVSDERLKFVAPDAIVGCDKNGTVIMAGDIIADLQDARVQLAERDAEIARLLKVTPKEKLTPLREPYFSYVFSAPIIFSSTCVRRSPS